MERWPSGLGRLKLEFVCDCDIRHRKTSQIRNSFKVSQCPRGELFNLRVEENFPDQSSESWDRFQQRIAVDSRFRSRNPDSETLAILTDKLLRDRIECHLAKRKRVGSQKLLSELLRLNPESAPNRIIEALSKSYNSQFHQKKSELALLGYGFLSEHREFGRSLKTLEEVLESILKDGDFYKVKISNKRILAVASSAKLTLQNWREIALAFDENAYFMLELIRKHCSKMRPTKKELELRQKEEERKYAAAKEEWKQTARWRSSPQPRTKERRERDLPWSITPFSDRRGHPKGRR